MASLLDLIPLASQASALIGPTLTLMVLVFLCMLLALLLLSYTLTRAEDDKGAAAAGRFLPSEAEPEKLQFERYALGYTVVWIFLFGIVVVCQLYEQFTADSYMQLCVSLALPLLLQPLLYPFPAEARKPFWRRYSFKANLWIAIYSFIGNYWYTQVLATPLIALVGHLSASNPPLPLPSLPVLLLGAQGALLVPVAPPQRRAHRAVLRHTLLLRHLPLLQVTAHALAHAPLRPPNPPSSFLQQPAAAQDRDALRARVDAQRLLLEHRAVLRVLHGLHGDAQHQQLPILQVRPTRLRYPPSLNPT